jgi:hypothetical protein
VDEIEDLQPRIHAHRSRRNEARASVVAIAAMVMGMLWWVLLGFRPWMMLGALVSLRIAWLHRRAAMAWEAKMGPRRKWPLSELAPLRAFGDFEMDDTPWYGGAVSVGGDLVALMLREDELLEARCAVARRLMADSDRLAESFARDVERAADAEASPQLAEELRGLRLHSISFCAQEPVGIGDVYFTEGELWTASYLDFTFFDFRTSRR